MKKFNILIICLFYQNFLQAQTNPITINRSKGAVATTNPIPAVDGTAPLGPLFGLGSGVESFRFGSGLVTQLDLGNAFNFDADKRWFSLGRLEVGLAGAAQRTLYGLRFQRAGQALTMGYGGLTSAPTVASNPFIEWIGNSGLTPAVDSGNLEFYTTNSPGGPTGPGTRRLSFTLRSDLTALLGEVSNFPTVAPGGKPQNFPKLELNAINQPAILANISGSNQIEAYGLKAIVSNGTASSVSNNYGVISMVTSNLAANKINCGIFAAATGTQSIVAGPLGNYAGYFGGTVYATQGLYGSDARLKKDIKNEESALSKLKLLNPVSYNFIANKPELKLDLPLNMQHGFIAQELEKIYPELVTDVLHPIFNEKNQQIDTRTLKAVNYIGLISVLTQSIKELATEVETLKSQKSEKTIVVNNTTKLTSNEVDKLIQTSYTLDQNVPNPFSSITSINYSLPENETDASILILNLNGQLLQEYKLEDAKGTITIEGSKMSKGIYLYSLVSNNVEIITKKMIFK